LVIYFTFKSSFFLKEPSVQYSTLRSANGVISWDDKVILITGIAGFIGYSLASEIAKQSNATVVGVDSFNHYYDVRLKYTRADLLSHYPHVHVVAGDVCDGDLMRELFQTYQFTHVVHLAAQAGVRYSLTKPFTYIRENIQCFLNILETLRYVATTNISAPRFLYASSSSVYGANLPPFTEEDRVDSPTNLYSVTKLTNELIATAYHHLFDINSIGLRFFTVYGPWGRPDMAPYIFTDSIERGVNITVFNNGNMARDFTYIDDIVSGIMLAMQYNVKSSTVFNFGNNKAEPVFELIRTIEEILGKRALVHFASSNTEIATTFASIEKAQSLLRYQPQTDLRRGMRKFIDWYSLYSWSRLLCTFECADQDRCISSSLDEAARLSVLATQGCDIVVYSTFIGDAAPRAPGLPPRQSNTTGDGQRTCFVIFSNRKVEQVGLNDATHTHWHVIPVKRLVNVPWWDHRRISRVFKLSPTLFFASSVRYVIYQDAKLKLSVTPQSLIENLSDSSGRRAFFCAMRHPVRSSPFAESEAITAYKKRRDAATYTLRTMDHQMDTYRAYQKTSNVTFQNMIDGALLIHDIRHPCGRKLRCLWAKEFYKYSDRDQLSFTYALSTLAEEAGATLSMGQEWISTACTNGDGDVGYVRILPNERHWDFSKAIAQYRVDGLH